MHKIKLSALKGVDKLTIIPSRSLQDIQLAFMHIECEYLCA